MRARIISLYHYIIISSYHYIIISLYHCVFGHRHPHHRFAVAVENDPESYGGKRKAKKAAKTARKAKEAQYKLCLKVLRQWVIDN